MRRLAVAAGSLSKFEFEDWGMAVDQQEVRPSLSVYMRVLFSMPVLPIFVAMVFAMVATGATLAGSGEVARVSMVVAFVAASISIVSSLRNR